MLKHSYSGLARVTKIAHQSRAMLLDKANTTVDLIDVGVVLSRSISIICPDKTKKYAALAEELTSSWKLRNIKVKAVIILAIGVLSSAQTTHLGDGVQGSVWTCIGNSACFCLSCIVAHFGNSTPIFH